MHELSVCQALLDQVEALARTHHASRVERIVLQVGPLSGVEGELLRTAYPIAAAGTVAEDAELVLEAVPVRVRCRTCGHESDAAPNRLVCGQCGDYRTDLASGDELLLARVELALVAEDVA
jgi:hydrogenase nickel incorporation protein HypA/HybF